MTDKHNDLVQLKKPFISVTDADKNGVYDEYQVNVNSFLESRETEFGVGVFALQNLYSGSYVTIYIYIYINIYI